MTTLLSLCVNKSHCFMSPWSFCCLRYYWSFYSSSSPIVLVWFWWHSYFLVYFLSIFSNLCRFYQLYFLCNFSPSSRCSTRISPWTTLIHTLYYSSQFSYLWFVCLSSSICRWHSIVHLLPSIWILRHILHLQNTIDLVSQWMSANLLSLNQSKTEFLFIDLPAQLSKISYPSLLMPSNVTITPAQSARNLGVIFDSTLSMSDHISSVSKYCFLSIRDLRRIRNTLLFHCSH